MRKEEHSTVDMMTIIVALVAVAIGVGLGYFILQRQSIGGQRRLAEVEDNAAETRASAEAEKKAILLEAKEEAIRVLGSAEEDARQLRLEVGAQERRLRQKEENLDRKTDELETRQRRLQLREEEADVHHRLRRHQVEAEATGRHVRDVALHQALADPVEERCRKGGHQPGERVHGLF